MITQGFTPATGRMRFASHVAFRGVDGPWAQLSYLSWMRQPLQLSVRLLVRAGAMASGVTFGEVSPLLRFFLSQSASRYADPVRHAPVARDGMESVVRMLAQGSSATPFAAPHKGMERRWRILAGSVTGRDVLRRHFSSRSAMFRVEQRVFGRDHFSSWPGHADNGSSSLVFQQAPGAGGTQAQVMLRMPSLLRMSSLAWRFVHKTAPSAAFGMAAPVTLLLAPMARSAADSVSTLTHWLESFYERTNSQTKHSSAIRTASLWSRALHSMHRSTLAWKARVIRLVMPDRHAAAHDNVSVRVANTFSSLVQHTIKQGANQSEAASIAAAIGQMAISDSSSLRTPGNAMRYAIADGSAWTAPSITMENATRVTLAHPPAGNTVFVYRTTPPAAPSPVALQRQVERIGQQVTRRIVHEMMPPAPSREQMEQAVLAPRVVRELTRQVASMMAQRVSLERYRRGL